jgi:hypothetical protein
VRACAMLFGGCSGFAQIIDEREAELKAQQDDADHQQMSDLQANRPPAVPPAPGPSGLVCCHAHAPWLVRALSVDMCTLSDEP